MAVDALELRPRTTLQLFDAAIRLCSRSLGVWSVTLPAGAGLVAATFELIGAIAHHRPLVVPAALFTAAWMFRALTQLVVALNIHLFINGALIVATKLLAFDVTFVDRFVSIDNPVWFGALFALTFALFEPIRAASAALLLVDGRVCQEGLDLLTQL